MKLRRQRINFILCLQCKIIDLSVFAVSYEADSMQNKRRSWMTHQNGMQEEDIKIRRIHFTSIYWNYRRRLNYFLYFWNNLDGKSWNFLDFYWLLLLTAISLNFFKGSRPFFKGSRLFFKGSRPFLFILEEFSKHLLSIYMLMFTWNCMLTEQFHRHQVQWYCCTAADL